VFDLVEELVVEVVHFVVEELGVLLGGGEDRWVEVVAIVPEVGVLV
jgi:hypothetical protein